MRFAFLLVLLAPVLLQAQSPASIFEAYDLLWQRQGRNQTISNQSLSQFQNQSLSIIAKTNANVLLSRFKAFNGSEILRPGNWNEAGLLQAQSRGAILPLKLGFYGNSPKSPQDAFQFPNSSFTSAISEVDHLRLLASSEDAFQRKMQLLTGTKLPQWVIDNKEAGYAIQISQAPFYQKILISTLFIRKDFSGYLLSRALLKHAQRGTKIQLIYSRSALRGLLFTDRSKATKDQALLRELESHPNIEILKAAQAPAGRNLHELHRAHHAKVFLVIPRQGLFKKATAILGGRNISDSYLFYSPPDLKRHSALIQYGEDFHPAMDLEVEIRSSQLTQDISTQFSNYWHLHRRGENLPSSVIRLQSQSMAEWIKHYSPLNQKKTLVRHFLHVPYQQNGTGGDLDDLFVRLIDSARSRIDIVSPYLHMNPRILSAIARADQRGLQIHVVTNTDLTRDSFLPENTTQANIKGIEALLAYARIHGWTYPHIMLHAKAMIIDNQVSYIGSVNFNRRSFSHDVENGILIHSYKVAQELRQTIREYYIPNTHRIRSQELRALKERRLNKLIVDILPGLF